MSAEIHNVRIIRDDLSESINRSGERRKLIEGGVINSAKMLSHIKVIVEVAQIDEEIGKMGSRSKVMRGQMSISIY